MARDPAAEKWLAAAQSALDHLADDFGDGTARHCAALLRGVRQTGAPVIDDTRALAEIISLREAGHRRDAVRLVAEKLAKTPADVESVSRRLRGKLKRMTS